MDKIKVFGLYPGCEVIAKQKDREERFILAGVCEWVDGDFTVWAKNNTGYSSVGWDFQLILTPLEQISDEDAIEVAKMLVQHGSVNFDDHEIEVVARTDEKILVRIGGAWFHIYYTAQYLLTAEDEVIWMPIYNTAEVTDYLRSRYYNLPYMGMDLVENGIAVLKTK